MLAQASFKWWHRRLACASNTPARTSPPSPTPIVSKSNKIALQFFAADGILEPNGPAIEPDDACIQRKRLKEHWHDCAEPN